MFDKCLLLECTRLLKTLNNRNNEYNRLENNLDIDIISISNGNLLLYGQYYKEELQIKYSLYGHETLLAEIPIISETLLNHQSRTENNKDNTSVSRLTTDCTNSYFENIDAFKRYIASKNKQLEGINYGKNIHRYSKIYDLWKNGNKWFSGKT